MIFSMKDASQSTAVGSHKDGQVFACEIYILAKVKTSRNSIPKFEHISLDAYSNFCSAYSDSNTAVSFVNGKVSQYVYSVRNFCSEYLQVVKATFKATRIYERP